MPLQTSACLRASRCSPNPSVHPNIFVMVIYDEWAKTSRKRGARGEPSSACYCDSLIIVTRLEVGKGGLPPLAFANPDLCFTSNIINVALNSRLISSKNRGQCWLRLAGASHPSRPLTWLRLLINRNAHRVSLSPTRPPRPVSISPLISAAQESPAS